LCEVFVVAGIGLWWTTDLNAKKNSLKTLNIFVRYYNYHLDYYVIVLYIYENLLFFDSLIFYLEQPPAYNLTVIMGSFLILPLVHVVVQQVSLELDVRVIIVLQFRYQTNHSAQNYHVEIKLLVEYVHPNAYVLHNYI